MSHRFARVRRYLGKLLELRHGSKPLSLAMVVRWYAREYVLELGGKPAEHGPAIERIVDEWRAMPLDERIGALRRMSEQLGFDAAAKARLEAAIGRERG